MVVLSGGTIPHDETNENLDWHARRVEFAATAPVEILTDVRERLRVLLGL
jgi:hypothetical protein